MDSTVILFYAIVCGALALFSPAQHRPVFRAVIGAIVGIAAAIILPILRNVTGI